MKAVILAGGLGTRISEETGSKPKPMIEIGGIPIIQHIMAIYSQHGFNEFIVCCGYKGYVIKEYFSNFLSHSADVRVSLASNEVEILNTSAPNWEVTLVDTGVDSMTGERLKRVSSYLAGEERFFMTYGDGVGDIDLTQLLEFHRLKGKKATLTAVRPPARFGALSIDSNGAVIDFVEKPAGDNGFINGGFFALEQSVFDYLEDQVNPVWETGTLVQLASEGELSSFLHDGFWRPMDTLRDKAVLDSLAMSGEPPWLS